MTCCDNQNISEKLPVREASFSVSLLSTTYAPSVTWLAWKRHENLPEEAM